MAMSMALRLLLTANRVSLQRHAIRSPVTPPLASIVRCIKTGGDEGKKRSSHGDGIKPSDPHVGNEGGDIFVGPGVVRPPAPPKTAEDFANPKDHWVYYGFDPVDKKNDRMYTHVVFFIMITGVFYGWSLIIYYQPDLRLDNWATREAYLELERRTRLGGPLVDRDYVPAHLIKLPTEEELGDQEVII